MKILGLLALLTLTPLTWAQSTINMSHDLIGYGIASVNLTPNQPSLDAGPLLVQTVTYAQQNHVATITADQGAYYFLTEQQPGITVLLNSINNLTIDFQGSDLYIASQNFGIQFNNSSNVTLQNLTVDRIQLDYTQLLVTSVDPVGRQIQFSIPPGWQAPSALNTILSNAPGGLNPADAWAYAFRSGKQIQHRVSVNVPYANDHITLPANSVVDAFLSALRAGDVIVLCARFPAQAIKATCNNCTFRNIKIYAGDEGFDLEGPSSGTVLDHVYVMPKPGTDRLVSTMADGITMNQPGPNNTMQFCRAIRTLDDGFSPHIWMFAQVQSALTASSLQVAGVQTTALSQNLSLPNGSNVVFQQMSDGQILGNAVLVSQSSVTTVGGIPNVTLTFDRTLPTNLTNSFVYSTDASWRATGLTIERSTIQFQARVSSMTLWGMMNTTVTGNYIREGAGQGIAGLHTLAGGWETAPVVNLSIMQNVIDGAPTIVDLVDSSAYGAIQTLGLLRGNPGLMAISPNQNLTVANNFIAGASRSAVFVGNVTGASVTGNYFLNPNSNPAPADVASLVSIDVTQPISMEASTGVTTSGNTVDNTSGHVLVTDTGYRELAAYTPAALIRLNGYNLGTLGNPSVTLTDANGAKTPVSVKASGTHYLDVLLPGSALGGAYLTVTAGGATYFGTLFLDSVDSIPALNGCTYQISPSPAAVPSGGGSASILVVTQSGCSYTVLATNAFVTPGAGGTGTGVASVAFSANTGAARSVTIEIAAWQFAVTQSGVPPPQVSTAGVVNGASFGQNGQVSPGEIVSVFGSALATASTPNSGFPLPTTLGGIKLTMGGVDMPLFFAGTGQVNGQVPTTLAPNTQASLVARAFNGTTETVDSTTVTVTVAANTPGIFIAPESGAPNQGAILNNPGLQVVDSTHPATAGDVITIYCTGLGATTLTPATGAPSPAAEATHPVTVTFGTAAPVASQYAGLTPGLVGLYQVNVAVPAGLTPGSLVPVVLNQNGVTSNTATIAVK